MDRVTCLTEEIFTLDFEQMLNESLALQFYQLATLFIVVLMAFIHLLT